MGIELESREGCLSLRSVKLTGLAQIYKPNWPCPTGFNNSIYSTKKWRTLTRAILSLLSLTTGLRGSDLFYSD